MDEANGLVGHNAIVSGDYLEAGEYQCECGAVLAMGLFGDQVWSSDGSFDSPNVTQLKQAHKRHVRRVLEEATEDALSFVEAAYGLALKNRRKEELSWETELSLRGQKLLDQSRCHCGDPAWGTNGSCGISGCSNVPA